MNKDDIRKKYIKREKFTVRISEKEFNQAIYQRLINSDHIKKSDNICFASFGKVVFLDYPRSFHK